MASFQYFVSESFFIKLQKKKVMFIHFIYIIYFTYIIAIFSMILYESDALQCYTDIKLTIITKSVLIIPGVILLAISYLVIVERVNSIVICF